VCVCVCVCERERERERKGLCDAALTVADAAPAAQVLRQGRQLDALHVFDSAHLCYEARQRQAEQRAADPVGRCDTTRRAAWFGGVKKHVPRGFNRDP
jgi:hypothetical protein